MSDRYDVTITLDADEGGRAVADALLEAFSRARTAKAAGPSGIRSEDHEVTVRFSELTTEHPAAGAEHQPPIPDEPSEEPGHRAIRELEEMPSEALVPIVRALVALVGARARAGMEPRQRLTIEIAPSPIHGQDELRYS